MKNLLNKLKCALRGHIDFECGEPVRFMQPRGVGDKTMTICLCERCHSVYLRPGVLSKEELEAERIIEAKAAQMQLDMDALQEKTIKRLTELAIERGGKVALN